MEEKIKKILKWVIVLIFTLTVILQDWNFVTTQRDLLKTIGFAIAVVFLLYLLRDKKQEV